LLIFYGLQWRLKLKYGLKKELVRIILLLTVFCEIVILGLNVFNSDFIAIMILYPIAVSILLYGLYDLFNKKNIMYELILEQVESLNASMNQLSASSEQINGSMMSLNNSAEDIKTTVDNVVNKTDVITPFIKTIKGISDKMNLLALNATIEAGRSVNNDKGFGVVAKKFSELSEQTKTIIEKFVEDLEQIPEDISGVNESISKQVASIEEASSATEEQTAVIEEISESTVRLVEKARRN
jgi:predicted  nucleic acid-binding Zn-ribbon protein